MAQYVVHKIGFWYTDECFAVGEEKGTVVSITRSLEEAQARKKLEDITSMKGVTSLSPVNFYFESDHFEEIDKKMKAYCRSEFDISLNHLSELPKQITDEQAMHLLSIMELSFHTIVEYGDEEVINPEDFEFDEEEGEISGF